MVAGRDKSYFYVYTNVQVSRLVLNQWICCNTFHIKCPSSPPWFTVAFRNALSNYVIFPDDEALELLKLLS